MLLLTPFNYVQKKLDADFIKLNLHIVTKSQNQGNSVR